MKRVSVISAMIGFSLIATSCSPGAQPLGPEIITAHADSALPIESLEDWVTYGDALVELTTDSTEVTTPPSDEESKRGEGSIGRHLLAKVGEPVWTRPTLKESTTLPETLKIGAGGYVFNEKEIRRWRPEDRLWIEPDRHYLALISYGDYEFQVTSKKPASDGNPKWMTMTIMACEEDVVTASETPELGKDLIGKSTKEIGQLLDSTPIDPNAEKHMDEDPVLRYQLVAANR